MSSERLLPLQGGKMHPTGYFLNEFGVPAKRLVDAGYELVLATPRGNIPALDASSDHEMFFKDKAEHEQIKEFVNHFLTTARIQTTQDAAKAGMAGYDALFLPGGHAPMIDLMSDPGLGQLLAECHATAKPTALICHAPTALLAAQADAQGYQKAVEAGEKPAARAFVYDGYRATVYSNAEETMTEKTFEAKELYYPADALTQAGLKIENGTPMKSFVVRDRELLTGQNPFSDSDFVEQLLEMLGRQGAETRSQA